LLSDLKTLESDSSRDRQTHHQFQKQHHQTILSIKQEISCLVNKIETVTVQRAHDFDSAQQHTKRLEREIRETKETSQQDAKSFEHRYQNLLQSQSQQTQNQLQSLRLELFAEVRRQQYGNDFSGFMPFMIQLILPFLSIESVQSLIHGIRSIQGVFLQKYLKSFWVLLLFGDIASRWLEQYNPIIYQLVIPKIPISDGKRWTLGIVRLTLEIVVACQIFISFVSYFREKTQSAKQKCKEIYKATTGKMKKILASKMIALIPLSIILCTLMVRRPGFYSRIPQQWSLLINTEHTTIVDFKNQFIRVLQGGMNSFPFLR